MKNSKKAFTLVELIVVITILAILGTIAFISLQGYSKDTRNSVRLSDLSNINKMLGIKMVTAGKVPVPDNYVEITASGVTLNYQGEAGGNVLPALGVSNGGKDPKDETYYTYSTNTNLTKYQLLGFMEGDAIASVLTETFAVSDLSERAVKVYGDDVGILLDSVTNIPLTETVDVVNTTTNYKITFTDESLIEGTGTTLFSSIYNRNENLLNNKELAKLDESLVGYWDMETMTGSYLGDLSKYGNYGTLNGSILVGGENGKSGKATYFDGTDDFIEIINPNLINDSMSSITISAWVRIDIVLGYLDINYGIIESWVPNSSGFNLRINDALVPSSWIGKYQFITDNGSYTSITADTNTYPNDNSWNFITAVLDNTTGTIYLNGNAVKVNSNMNDISEVSGSIFLGKNFPEGIIDEVRIYNRALSDDEVKALYNSTK